MMLLLKLLLLFVCEKETRAGFYDLLYGNSLVCSTPAELETQNNGLIFFAHGLLKWALSARYMSFFILCLVYLFVRKVCVIIIVVLLVCVGGAVFV